MGSTGRVKGRAITRNLEACGETIFWIENDTCFVTSVVGETGDGDLNMIRQSLSGFLGGGESSSLLGKMSKIPGQVLPLAKVLRRRLGTSVGIPEPRAHRRVSHSRTGRWMAPERLGACGAVRRAH